MKDEDGSAHRPAIELNDVRFAWRRGAAAFSISIAKFDVARGERVLLIGPSGSGKSTLLGLICGTLLPQSGKVLVLGQDLAALNGPRRDRFRASHIGVIFQMFNLLPYLSILDNALLPLSFSPERRNRASARTDSPRGEATRLLRALGLDLDALNQNDAAELSVGQQQRVAAARALIGSPELIIADEPTSALDRDRQTAFLELLFKEVASSGSTLLMVSHDETLAAHFDRRVSIDALTAPS